ncbi:MAG TPA: tetratricopeptide repeat protein [Kofleriaceae bacterium]
MGDLLDLTARLAGRRGTRRGTPATVWYQLASSLEASDPAGAAAAYERALAGQPDFADAHNNLGRVHHDAGRVTDAEGCYRLAIACNAKVALYWFNLGVAVEDQGRRAEAIAAYERAVSLDRSLADAHFNLARLLEQLARGADDPGLFRRAVRHLSAYRSLAFAR